MWGRHSQVEELMYRDRRDKLDKKEKKMPWSCYKKDCESYEEIYFPTTYMLFYTLYLGHLPFSPPTL